MALKLIRRDRTRVNVKVAPGTGWQNLTVDGGNPYLTAGMGEVQLTVTVTGCDGVRIYDWGKDQRRYAENVSQGGIHTVTALITGQGVGAVARVLNPTDKTEVIVTAIPIPPPLLNSWVARLVGWSLWR